MNLIRARDAEAWNANALLISAPNAADSVLNCKIANVIVPPGDRPRPGLLFPLSIYTVARASAPGEHGQLGYFWNR
jgi:hypothetical protein